MEREVGGGIGMGNTCKPMAVSFQCMTKSTTHTKKKRVLITQRKKKEKENIALLEWNFFQLPPLSCVASVYLGFCVRVC